MLGYAQGQHDALLRLGLTKEAVAVMSPAKSVLGRFGGWLRKKLPTARGVRRGIVGSPRTFKDELMSGRALSKGSLIRESFRAPDMFSKAMFYGLPAVEAGSIALDDKDNKAQRIGGSLGGAALGLAAYRPLGLLGAMGAGMVGHNLGEGIGKTVGNLSETKPNNPWEEE